MKTSELQEIIGEEIQAVLEISMTKRFTQAVEELQKIQLAQQKLRKKFVAEKDPKKKEKLKQAIIKMHKAVQKAELSFNDAIKSEPVEDLEESKGRITEKSKTAKQLGLSDDFDEAVADLKDKEFNTKSIIKLAKKHKQNPKKAVAYVKDAFEWLWKEGINEGGFDPYVIIKKNGIITGRATKLQAIGHTRKKNDLFAIPDKPKVLKKAQKLIKSLSGAKLKDAMFDLRFEGILKEDVWKSFQGDIPGSKIYTAHNTDKRKSVEARKTDKVWDDGVPVLKYIARASKKSSPLPKGKFKIVDDSKYGWWYYQVGKTWYGIQQKDYGTPPFEY